MYVDSHAHLEHKQFDSDREAMIARAREAGLAAVLAIGNGDGPASVECAIPFAEKYDWVWATIGVHPHEASLADQAAWQKMEQLAKNPRVIAWGEIGLDYHYDYSPRDVQKRVLVEQLELAKSAKLPIIIHVRASQNSTNAWDNLLPILRENWASSGLGGVMHCFGGEVEHARASLDLGFVISFAGNITFPKAQNIRDAAGIVPLDRFFMETDSPYLAPVPHRGKRNEPAFVRETARQVAELRGLTPEEAGSIAAENFFRFFNLPRP
ncbi:MAG TPA: TatD family hydrolase [Candidatus Acidoferrales bacterium]|nr:TatD family hydrolase [Candidatus Acidoferrales bacterium]